MEKFSEYSVTLQFVVVGPKWPGGPIPKHTWNMPDGLMAALDQAAQEYLQENGLPEIVEVQLMDEEG